MHTLLSVFISIFRGLLWAQALYFWDGHTTIQDREGEWAKEPESD